MSCMCVTGFVCFMNRVDAEEAMEACSETDPFNVGRLLMMRWGKNVKKIVKRGTGGGIALAPILKRPRASFLYSTGPGTDEGDSQFHDGANNDDPQCIPLDGEDDEEDYDEDSTRLSNNRKDSPPGHFEMRTGFASVSKPVKYQRQLHSKDAIRVQAPPNRERFNFITRVAFFVSKDGSHLEKRLLQRESRNPEFDFLQFSKNAFPQERLDHIFYRWRVFAFCQGDGFSVWRTEPFVMFHPHGRFWIPPPLDEQAARQEEMYERARQEALQEQKKQRRRLKGKREYRTGRQIERAQDGRRGGKPVDGGSSLSPEELEQFNLLVKKKLSASRKTICAAMAFCFEKSGAAKEISELVQEALTDPSASLDMRIARLYLLSDILFNSQQPGVKNAFLYRDAIEKMAASVFTSLGKHGGGNVGRMTMNKLRTAVSGVLGAWTEWSVYNPTFMDELEARFEGREIKDHSAELKEAPHEDNQEQQDSNEQEEYTVNIDKPRGDWTEVKEEDEEEVPRHKKSKSLRKSSDSNKLSHRHQDKTVNEYNDPNGDSLGVGDLDGEELDVDNYDLDGSPVSDLPTARKSHRIPPNLKRADGGRFDGDPIEQEEDDDNEGTDSKVLTSIQAIDSEKGDSEVLDGEPIDAKDLDGESFDGEKMDSDKIDGESLDGDLVDSESLDGKLDGKPVHRQSLDDGAIDGDSIDGDAIDGESIDGKALDDVDGDEL
jgi:hypothetical protein